jgi:adenine/guanine phosphoribosyltransferase-like PRPP-binding protein
VAVGGHRDGLDQAQFQLAGDDGRRDEAAAGDGEGFLIVDDLVDTGTTARASRCSWSQVTV